jgi:hypothetical protein
MPIHTTIARDALDQLSFSGLPGYRDQDTCTSSILTCPDFQTTAEFLPAHHQQAQLTRELLDSAEAAGRERQAQNHRTVLVNLDKIIASLQALRPTGADGNA